jgi:hypothetical protein
MKDYKEMAESVFHRRDQYMEKRSRQRRAATAVVSCCCLVALVGVGVWRSGALTHHRDAASEGIPVGGASSGEPSTRSAEQEMGLAAFADYGGGLDADLSGYSIQPMISSFGETKMDRDISVHNGGVLFSQALQGAMAQYGGDVKYQVLVELFSGGAELDCASVAGRAEMERFGDQGYTVAFESYYDGYVDHNYFTLHATLEQLENFPSSEEYGYCVMLYGERVETTGGLENAVSGTDLFPGAAGAGSEELIAAK